MSPVTSHPVVLSSSVPVDDLPLTICQSIRDPQIDIFKKAIPMVPNLVLISSGPHTIGYPLSDFSDLVGSLMICKS